MLHRVEATEENWSCTVALVYLLIIYKCGEPLNGLVAAQTQEPRPSSLRLLLFYPCSARLLTVTAFLTWQAAGSVFLPHDTGPVRHKAPAEE